MLTMLPFSSRPPPEKQSRPTTDPVLDRQNCSLKLSCETSPPWITAAFISFTLIALQWRVRAPQDDGVDSDEGQGMGGEFAQSCGALISWMD